jgi:hypothetical protein
MEIRLRVDQLPQDRVRAPQKLSRHRIGHRSKLSCHRIRHNASFSAFQVRGHHLIPVIAPGVRSGRRLPED